VKLASGFSLSGALFATAVAAVLLASLRLGLQSQPPDLERLAGVAVLGLLAGWLLGIGIGVRQIGGWRGATAGVIAGTLFGPAGGLLLVLPAAIPGAAVGSLVLVALAAILRRLSAART
jgi:hypothetical protein